MSHQTGIVASDELRRYIAKAKLDNLRLLKIVIENEMLVLGHSEKSKGSWEKDWDSCILPLLEEAQPCYIFYRLDSKNSTGHEWIFMSYSPDYSKVRQKMLYAATRATLKKEFGGSQVKDDIFATAEHELSFAGYQRHVTAQKAPAPLTVAEEELQEIKRNESATDVSVDSKHQTMQGIAFPVAKDAMDQLELLKQGTVTYVQLMIDLKAERVLLASSDTIGANQLVSRIPSESARYHFFLYKHSHEGDYLESIVFIYSMPGYKCPIKERMLYSSCKSPLIDTVQQHLGMEIARKLEIDDPTEVTEQFLYEEVHPQTTIVKQKFSRPKGPGGRGPKRLTKP